MKKGAVLLIMLLFAAAVHAYSLEYTQDTIRVPIGGTRQTDVVIKSERADSFVISPLDAKTWVTTDRTIVPVSGGEDGRFTVHMSPTAGVPEGLHKISFEAESQATKEKKRADIFAYVYKSEGVEIENILLTGELLPSGVVNVKFSLRNIGEVKQQNLELATTAYSPDGKIFESQDEVTLEPQDVKSFEKSFALEENAPPGDYSVVIKVVQLEKTLNEVTEKFVVARKAVIKDLSTTNYYLLKKEKKFLFRNVGNEKSEPLVVEEKITKFDSNFFRGDAPDRVEGDMYVWALPSIQPGGSARIEYALDYTPLFFFLLIIMALAWVYLTRFRTLRVSKYILQKKHIREGEEFTIGVEVRNFTGGGVEKADVYDFVPPIFQMRDTEGPKPTRKKSDAGTELKWTVSNLGRNEERVLTYKIMPVIELSGTIKLPAASVVFASRGKETENYSNAPALGIEPQGEEEGIHHKLRHHIKKFLKK